MFPVNWGLLIKENFGNEILDLCKKKNIAVLALKSMADRRWEEGEIRTHKNCWYKPITDPKLINLSIKFTLSKNVTSLLPPGDKDLFKKALELAKNYSELSNEEYLYLEDLSKTSKPIGDREEIFI